MECKEKLNAFNKEHIPAGIKVRHIIACGTAYEEILNLSKRSNVILSFSALTDQRRRISFSAPTPPALCATRIVTYWSSEDK